MGKKQKKSTKGAWNKSVVVKDYEEKAKVVIEEERLSNQPSKELFFEDKSGSARLRKVVFADDIESPLSKEEKLKIVKIKKQMAGEKVKLDRKRQNSSGSDGDLWKHVEQKKLDSKGFLKQADLEVSMKSRKTPRVVVNPNNYPAVPLPKAGMSYNPDVEQHQNILGEILACEINYEGIVARNNALPGGLTRKDINKQHSDPNILASSLLFDEDEDNDNHDIKLTPETNGEKAIFLGPTQDKKIPAAKRRSRIRHEKERYEAMLRRKARELLSAAGRSKSIGKAVEEEEKRRERERLIETENRELRLEQTEPSILRGGMVVYPFEIKVPNVNVLLSDEVTGNLRTMKNVVSPVNDRFDTIDRRHLVQLGGEKEKEKYRHLRLKKGLYRGIPW